MNKEPGKWRAIVAGCVLALAACRSSPTRIYALDPAAPSTHIDTYQAAALHVDSVSVPGSWDRLEILSRSAAGGLQINDFDQWSAPLAQIARQALSDDLDQRLPPGSVVYPRLPKPPGALGINVDILEFNADASQASMRASWLIVPAAGPQSARRSVALLHDSLTSTGPAGMAHAWSTLIGQLADHIAADAASFAMP